MYLLYLETDWLVQPDSEMSGEQGRRGRKDKKPGKIRCTVVEREREREREREIKVYTWHEEKIREIKKIHFSQSTNNNASFFFCFSLYPKKRLVVAVWKSWMLGTRWKVESGKRERGDNGGIPGKLRIKQRGLRALELVRIYLFAYEWIQCSLWGSFWSIGRADIFMGC